MNTDAPTLAPSTDSPYWRGAVGWVQDGPWWQPWRLLPERAARAHAPGLLWTAQMPAGVRLQMRTDATAVRLPIENLSPEREAHVDVLIDGEQHSRTELSEGATQLDVALDGGTREVQIWLPQAALTRVGAATVDGGTVLQALPEGPRWVTYGSSITQCAAAHGPSQTWPALVARRWGWDLTCLGFSGQCHLDPIAARTIAATPADLVTLCLGINIYGNSSFNERSLAPQVAGFIDQVRDAHPGVPIVVITPIASPDREDTPNEAGMFQGGELQSSGLTLSQVRTIVADVTTAARADDPDVHLIDGRDILSADEAHLMPDGLHPDGTGYELMASRLAPRLAEFAPQPVA